MSFNHFTWSLFSNMTEMLEAPVWPLTSPSNSAAFRRSTRSLQSLDNSLSTQSDSTQTHNKLNIHIFMQEMFELEELKKGIKEICKKEDKGSDQPADQSDCVHCVCVFILLAKWGHLFWSSQLLRMCVRACVPVCPITLMNCCRSHHTLFSLDLHLFFSSSSVLPPCIHLQPSDIFSGWLMLWCCKEQLMFHLCSSWMCVYQVQHINCSSFINVSFLCRWILDIRLIFSSLSAFLKCLL